MGYGKNFKRNFPHYTDVRTCFSRWTTASVNWLTGHWCDVAQVLPHVPRVTIAMLPDVALLEIFDFYVHGALWYRLVQVCRKWRNVVFGSPGRLGLRLYCTAGTPVTKTLDVWPLLPIVINADCLGRTLETDNIIAALKHNDRICKLSLAFLSLEKVLAAMQQPFPALTDLDLVLRPGDEIAPIDANSFLGGSAPPHLQKLRLCRIPFPGLPKLLLSAIHLVQLDLWIIPHSGYFSPEVMATGLSALIRLETLIIKFESPRSRPDRRHPPRPTRTLLPVLTKLQFKGVSEYLEDLVARIDAPLLDELEITFFHQLLFDTPHLSQFIGRTPRFKAYNEARVVFHDWVVSTVSVSAFDGRLCLIILCISSDWQLSSLAQVCSSSFPQALISTVEHLFIEDGSRMLYRPEEIESSQWLELFHSFTAVKHLYISPRSMPSIASALQEFVGESMTEVLPTLETLFLEKLPSRPVQEAIEKFVSSRQLSNHPISVSRWEGSGFDD